MEFHLMHYVKVKSKSEFTLSSPGLIKIMLKSCVPVLKCKIIIKQVVFCWRVIMQILVTQTVRETWIQSLSWGRYSGEGNGNPSQYSCLGNLKDRGA